MKKYLAFDVGGTSVKYAVVNEEGEVSSSNRFKTPDTLEKMYQEIENVAHEYQDIEGIALSMPGAVDSDWWYYLWFKCYRLYSWSKY